MVWLRINGAYINEINIEKPSFDVKAKYWEVGTWMLDFYLLRKRFEVMSDIST